MLRAAVPEAALAVTPRSLAHRLVVCGDPDAAGRRVDPEADVGAEMRTVGLRAQGSELGKCTDTVASAFRRGAVRAVAADARASRRAGHCRSAGERYALIVAGASGGQEYATQYAAWTSDLRAVLVDRMKIERANFARADRHATPRPPRPPPTSGSTSRRAPRDDARRSAARSCSSATARSTASTPSSTWSAPTWSRRSGPPSSPVFPAGVVVVNTSSASFPFIERLTGDRRVVITATDSVAQRFDTVFPDYFIKALPERRGRHRQERPHLDLGGVRRGHRRRAAPLPAARPARRPSGRCSTTTATASAARPAGPATTARSRATSTSTSRCPGAPPTDEVLLKLLQKRAALEADLEELKVRRSFLRPAEYQTEFERLMVELARVNQRHPSAGEVVAAGSAARLRL